jgi:hypothetical protein
MIRAANHIINCNDASYIVQERHRHRNCASPISSRRQATSESPAPGRAGPAVQRSIMREP